MTRRLQLIVIAIAVTLAAGSAAWTATHPVKPNPVTPTPTVVTSTTSPASAAAPLPAAEVTPAAALAASTTVYPQNGEGWIHLTQRVCGTSANWMTVAAGRRLYAGQAVSVNCGATGTTTPTASWVKPVATMTCRPAGGAGAYGAKRPLVGPWRYSHQGVDLGATAHVYGGNPIRSVAAGTVTRAGYISGSAGNGVWVNHAGGVQTRSYHMASVAVKVGQHVNAGQILGYVGATGDATGPHLHLELLVNGTHVNPGTFLAAHGVRIGC